MSITNPGATQSQTQLPVFTIFSRLPVEIRVKIWWSSVQPRIIRWIRKDNKNVFVAPSRSLPMFEVCQESRETAILYGSYKKLPGQKGDIWFSPVVDFLFFDPGWMDLIFKPHVKPPIDLLESLDVLPALKDVRNVMVLPNYTDLRKKPSASFDKLHSLERILVAADEKSIGIQSKFMLGTRYDMQVHYAAILRRKNQDVRIPYIAIGCLGWVGEERKTMHHGDEDKRELMAICDTHTQMMAHLSSVREEQWKFIQERRAHSKVTMNLHWRDRDGVDGERTFTKTHPTTDTQSRISITRRLVDKLKGWSPVNKWRPK